MTDGLHDSLRAGIRQLEEEFEGLDTSFKLLATRMEGPDGDSLSGLWNRIRSNFKDIFDRVRTIENNNHD